MKKLWNASLQCIRLVHSSSSRFARQHRECHGSRLFFAAHVLQLDRPAHASTETQQRVRIGSDVGSRKQAPQVSLDLKTTKSRDFAQSHAHSESPIVFTLSAKVLPGTFLSSNKHTTTRHMSSRRVSFGLGCPSRCQVKWRNVADKTT